MQNRVYKGHSNDVEIEMLFVPYKTRPSLDTLLLDGVFLISRSVEHKNNLLFIGLYKRWK